VLEPYSSTTKGKNSQLHKTDNAWSTKVPARQL